MTPSQSGPFKISNVLTLPSPSCLRALCQFSQKKNLPITSPSTRPGRTRHAVLQRRMLKQPSSAKPFGFNGITRSKKEREKEQEMIICISANLSSQNLAEQNEPCQAETSRADFERACQRVSGAHLRTCPSPPPQGAIQLLLALAEERWGVGGGPLPLPVSPQK